MPESGAKSHLVNNGKTVQSAWLTHWTGTKPETSKQDHLTQISRSESNDLNDNDFKNHMSGVEIASDNFGCSKEIKDADLTMSLLKPSTQSFPFFKRGQETQVANEKLTRDFNLETSRECHLQPTKQVKYHMFFGESSYKLDTHTTHEPENACHLATAFASKPKGEKTEMPSFPSHHSPTLIEEQYKRMQKHIGMGFFPRQTGSQQHGQYSLQNVPHFVHDVEMTRMPGGIHSFSRTTQSLLITKQTDVKVYQESQFFRESRASTQLKGEVYKELNYNHPHFGQSRSHFGQSQQGVTLQLLDSSDHDSGYVQKNESSADTDTMDMESYKENHLSGAHLFPPKKDIITESNIGKNKHSKRKIELPDINLEVSPQPAASSSTEKGTSRTQSLDMNTLHFIRDQTTNSNSISNSNSNSNSNECSNSNPGSDPGSRWIKRLKLTETPSHGRLSRFFTTVRVMEGKTEPVLESLTGQRVSESSSVETQRERKEITLSDSWIRRWSHKQNQKNPETCQMDSSKSEMEELEKKQFPSIAAMALMGKAMTGFTQFKLQKKESFVVWNTKAFDEECGLPGIKN